MFRFYVVYEEGQKPKEKSDYYLDSYSLNSKMRNR
jgi:hypothetical protein